MDLAQAVVEEYQTNKRESRAPLPIHVISGRDGEIEFDSSFQGEFIVIDHCHYLTVYVKVKVAKILFVDCTHLQIFLDASSFGPLECFKCSHVHLNSTVSLPFVYLEEVENCIIKQGSDQAFYILDLCNHIKISHDSKVHVIPINFFEKRHIVQVDRDGIKREQLGSQGFQSLSFYENTL